MKYEWLNNQNNKNLIVFFNGWAMNSTAVSQLKTDKFDILMINDYSDFDLDFSKFEFENYDKKYLICWSMGVYTVNLFYSIFNNFDKKIAINGTQKMIDDNFGIPKKVFNMTLKYLNRENMKKFISNMFDNDIDTDFLKLTKSIDELKQELVSIQNLSFDNLISFDKALISNHDKIVPAINQKKFWQNKCDIELLNSGHFPFFVLDSWDKIIC